MNQNPCYVLTNSTMENCNGQAYLLSFNIKAKSDVSHKALRIVYFCCYIAGLYTYVPLPPVFDGAFGVSFVSGLRCFLSIMRHYMATMKKLAQVEKIQGELTLLVCEITLPCQKQEHSKEFTSTSIHMKALR